MEKEERLSLRGSLSTYYNNVFYKHWPIWFAGFLVGVLNVLMFAYNRPWGVFAGIRLWGYWLFDLVGIEIPEGDLVSPAIQSTSVLDISLFVGAFAAALLAKEFGIRIPPKGEAVKGFVGGSLMGIGAVLVPGCNIGGFFTPVSALSLVGFGMMIGLILGAYVGVKYLFWEVSRMAIDGGTPVSEPKPAKTTDSFKLKIQPYVGLSILILAIVIALLYENYDRTVLGGLFLIGMTLGLVLQRSRLCMVRAFREPFMTGDSEHTRGVALAVIVGIIGFSILKWAGLRSEMTYVAGFGLHSVIGGFIFGIGMVLAGGCASGSIWRAGEGQVKLWIAVFGFAIASAALTLYLKSIEFSYGARKFLPNILGWKGAIVAAIVVMCIWFVVAVWNDIRRS